MVTEKIPITNTGFEKLEAELRQLKTVERPNVIQAIAEARAHGDLSENAEYHAARERQGFIEGRIAELENKIPRMDVYNPVEMSGEKAVFGATITVYEEESDSEKTYQIVGADESDIESGKLSISSPMARALIGKETGDEAEVKTPNGPRHYEVVSIEFK
ncbi:MAG: transcription elongation factor GreA [Alphaproteobacteria bacterium]